MNEHAKAIEKRLARIAPSATGLVRDELFFAAGRASVRAGRIWPVITGLLAAAQVCTLVLLVRPGSGGPTTPSGPPVVSTPAEVANPESVADPGFLQVRRDGELPPAPKAPAGVFAAPSQTLNVLSVHSDLSDY